MAESFNENNTSFINSLKNYAGFKKTNTQKPYKTFFDQLLIYRHQLDDRHEDVKRSLCAPLIKLHARFPKDFDWLRTTNTFTYDLLYRLVTDAYRNEAGIIGNAQEVINHILQWDSNAKWIEFDKRPNTPEFIRWHTAHYADKVDMINDYVDATAEQTKKLREIGERAQIELSPIEEIDAEIRGVPVRTPERIRTETVVKRTPQQDHPFLYNLLAFGFGVTFVVALLAIAIFIPTPTRFQLKVFTAVLALALAGASAVITGILNVKASIGTQFVIGSGGALAVFVIVFLINPAVL
jgi:hypothetical protein